MAVRLQIQSHRVPVAGAAGKAFRSLKLRDSLAGFRTSGRAASASVLVDFFLQRVRPLRRRLRIGLCLSGEQAICCQPLPLRAWADLADSPRAGRASCPCGRVKLRGEIAQGSAAFAWLTSARAVGGIIRSLVADLSFILRASSREDVWRGFLRRGSIRFFVAALSGPSSRSRSFVAQRAQLEARCQALCEAGRIRAFLSLE